MIHIIQVGQAGKTKYLIDMHQVRTKIFRDRMGWDVSVNDMDLEIDEYDLPDTVYIVSVNEHDQVVGTWRILSTSQPSMIKDIWPQYLKSLPIPVSNTMCEASRFGVLSNNDGFDRFGIPDDQAQKAYNQKITSDATAEMIVALIDVCIMCGITDMFTLYEVKVKRLLERIGFKPERISEVIELEGNKTITAQFKMNNDLADAVRSKTKIDFKLTPNDLPPVLLKKFINQQNNITKGMCNAV